MSLVRFVDYGVRRGRARRVGPLSARHAESHLDCGVMSDDVIGEIAPADFSHYQPQPESGLYYVLDLDL